MSGLSLIRLLKREEKETFDMQRNENSVGTKQCNALRHVLAGVLVAPLPNLLFVCLTLSTEASA